MRIEEDADPTPAFCCVPSGAAGKIAFEVISIETGARAIVVTRWIRRSPPSVTNLQAVHAHEAASG